MIEMKVSGSFGNTERFLSQMSRGALIRNMQKYASEGVQALRAATPSDSGMAAESWGSRVERTRSAITIYWTNTDIESGFPVAVMLQYGYYTGTGGYVQGRDYINPALAPVIDRLIDDIWRVVTSA